MKKNKELKEVSKNINFWLIAGLIAIVLAFSLGRDITRPFNGLHSWAQASGAWAARAHYNYGFGYTRFTSTWAVGNPPTENPSRYLDHPQLGCILKAGTFAIFGVNEWGPRVVNIFIAIISLLLFVRILKYLVDDKTALLAGLIYAIFPLTGYFGMGGWITVMGFWAIWCYFVLIDVVKKANGANKWHKIGLAVSLFMLLQFGWGGFFWAFAIGVHYVWRCMVRKVFPQIGILSTLVIAPLSSLGLNFLVMAHGYEWSFDKIIALYKWRSAKGEMAAFEWGAWLAKFWGFAITNFTLPVLIVAIAYLVFGQIYSLSRKSTDEDKFEGRRFPQFCLFLIIPISQLLVLRGALWKHQTWELPCGPVIAIAAACGVMLVYDILKRANRKLSITTACALVGCFVIFSIMGTNYYYDMRWQPIEKINMFKQLNEQIPPDKSLLSFEDFIVNQHKSKGGFYRPEIAWYLDREIVTARSFEEIQKQAATGEYPYYLIPQVKDLMPLINAMIKNYKYQYVPGVNGKTKNGKFLRAGMMSYLIFDLNSNAGG